MMNGVVKFLAAVVLACAVGVQADVVIETITVGNPGNAGEGSGESYGGYGPDVIVGGVDYTYNIGTFEVTAGQYRDFLNAVDPIGANQYGLYNIAMNSHSSGCQITWNVQSSTYDFSGRPSGTEGDWVDRPVNSVSWGDAARFANWLHNGQPPGAQDVNSTEDGSYDLTATHAYYGPGGEILDHAGLRDAMMAVAREEGATWVIPSEDEWYKASYHKNDGATGRSYFDYPTSSDTLPSNALIDPDPGNNATFTYYGTGEYTIGSPYWRTEVGAHESSNSPYGTFDQGGNVWEWNEAVILTSSHSLSRGIRGGSCDYPEHNLHAASRYYNYPAYEIMGLGFRVAVVPEPATIALLAFGTVGVFGRRRR